MKIQTPDKGERGKSIRGNNGSKVRGASLNPYTAPRIAHVTHLMH